MSALLQETIEPDTVRSPSGVSPVASRAGLAVSLGKRLNSGPWPAPLEAIRLAAKKVAWTAFEARLLTTPGRYAYRELIAGGESGYQLRATGVRFVIRHRSGDVDIFRKFYGYGYYEWPSEVRARLSGVGRPVNTLDLGANIGFFEVHAHAQLPVGRVVAFEPDPANGGVWERVRDANRADWELIKACASNREGVVRFTSGAHNFSRISGDGDFTVPAHDVYPHIAQADLVKVNIEGSEWEILEDPRLASTDQVWIVEYHRICNPREDITAYVRELFERVGYTTRIAASHNDNGLMWAWRDSRR